MIPIQELRVGNWINCKTKDGLQTGRIDNLLEFSNTLYFISAKVGKTDYQGKVTSENDCFEPIPITDELLLKCGFEKELFSSKIYKINTDDYCVIYYFEGDTLDVRTKDGNRVSILCKYLHQLQNAFYLATNKELKIEL